MLNKIEGKGLEMKIPRLCDYGMRSAWRMV